MQIPGEAVTLFASIVGIGAIVVGAAWKIARMISGLETHVAKELGEVKITIARIDERVAAIEPMKSRRVPTEPPGGTVF